MIDEVEAFNVALSASQILSIYNAGSGGKLKVPSWYFPPARRLRARR